MDFNPVEIEKTDEELFEAGSRLKTLGNEKFKSKDFKNAVDFYNEAITTLDKMKNWEGNEELIKLNISCL